MDGDTLLSWRPQNVVFIGLVLVGYLLLFGVVGQVYRRFSETE